jgi:ketosteroid isomerase-like protein
MSIPAESEALLRRSYDAFNRRDVDAVVATMHRNVDWPNMLEGTRVVGHDAVRAYWLGQFETIDPHVEPMAFRDEDRGSRSRFTRSCATRPPATYSPTRRCCHGGEQYP